MRTLKKAKRQRRDRGRAISQAVLVVVASAAGSARGASPVYTGPNAANWATASNWSTNAIPANGDNVSIGGFSPTRSGQSIYVTFNATNLSGTGLSSLTLDSSNCFEDFLLINGAGGSLIANNETIGNNITLNEVDQSAGTNSVGLLLTLGNNVNSSGTYNLTGTGLLSTQIVYVGNSGVGAFNQSGGTCNVSAGVVVGQLSSGSGVYTLGGTGVLNAAAEYLADNGTNAGITDIFNQTGGTNNLTGTGGLTVGSNGSGIYNLSGGTLNAAVNTSETLGFGVNGTGTFLQSNGVNNAISLLIGTTSGSGFYNLSGGNISTISGSQQIGIGTFTQTGGTNTVNSSNLAVGVVIGATGTYSLQGGALTLNSTNEYIGNGGFGVFNQSSGTHFLNYNSALYVGNTSTGTGVYQLQGGNLTISIGSEYIGNNGPGTFNQTGGTNTIENSSAQLEVGAGFTGTYNLISGNLINAGSETIGVFAAGTFNQSGGINTATDGLALGSGAAGTYLLSGGTLNASGGLSVGYDSYTSKFVQTNGVVNVSDIFEIGAFIGGANQPSTYNLSGGTLNVLGATDEVVGDDGIATFTQSGGLNLISGGLYIGTATDGVPGQTDYYYLSNGTVTAVGESVGYGTFGVFYQSGGTNNASGAGIVVAGGGYNATYNLSGGVINTTSLAIDNLGSFNLTGGTLNTAALNTNGAPSRLLWTGGILGLTAGITFDPSAGPTTTSAAFGSSLTLNSGMSLVVTGNETIGGGSAFTLTLNSGSTDTATGVLTVAPAGILVQNGGVISQNVINQGTYSNYGGSFTGQLNNQGTANFYVAATISNGLVNSGDINPLGLGVILNLGGQGLNNSGQILLGGGQIIATAGPIINSGLIYGFGSLTGTSVTNSGVITQINGNLQLNSSTAVFSNTGTINMTAGLSLTVSSGVVSNDGTFNLNGGNLITNATLTNNADGIVVGPGKITGSFVNNGTLDVPNGTTLTSSFTNTGVIEMSGVAAVLGSGATITNSSTIEGYGKISDSVTNNATIQPTNGTLTFTALVTNTALGTISIPPAGKVLMQGSATFPSNAGLIDLVGGTFDNGGNPLTNNGSILGYGILSTGGTGLTNAGAITFTGGTTTVNGNVANNGGKTINIKYQPAIFTGSLTNNTLAVINTISTTFTVAGVFTNNGTYNSDPATTIFQSSVVSGGSINGVTGDQYILYGGTFTNTGAYNNSGSIQSSDPTTNSGVFIQSGSQSWASGTTFNNTAGSATFNSDTGGGGPNLQVNAQGGLVAFSTTQHLASLNVSTGAGTVITGGGNGHRSMVFTPSLAVTGNLNLTNNDLDVQGGSLPAVTALIRQGYNHGTWAGQGITSSSAAGDPAHLTAVGVALNVITGTTPLYTTFDGQAVSLNDVLVKYTYYGDTNLDGIVDGSDYSRIDAAYLADRINPLTVTGWFNGDFNYDGVVDGSDYTLMDNAFNSQGTAQLLSQIASPTARISGSTATSVPEPVAISLMAIGIVGLIGRRPMKNV